MKDTKHSILTDDRRIRLAHAGYGLLFLGLAISFLLALRQAAASSSLSLLVSSF